MYNTKQITLITGAIIALSIMLINSMYVNPVQYANAVVSYISRQVVTSSDTLDNYGYYGNLDRSILKHRSTCTEQANIVDAGTLLSVANVTLSTTTGCATDLLNAGFACDNTSHRCVTVERGSSALDFKVVNMDANTATTYSYASMLGCGFRTQSTNNAGTIFAGVVAVSNCPITTGGIIAYSPQTMEVASTGIFTNTTYSAMASGSSVQDSCYDSTTGTVLFANAGNGQVIKYDVGTHAITNLNTGSSVLTRIYCDTGSAYVTSSAGNFIKKINISAMTVTYTISLTGASGVRTYGGNLFVSDGTTSLKIYVPSTGTQSGTIVLSLTGLQFPIGQNTTRFNGLSARTMFAITGYEDNSGGTPTSNIVNGVDCDDPTYQHTLLCALNAQGGAGSLSGSTQLIGQSANAIACQIGLVNGTISGNTCILDNPDLKTNGIGYIITIVSLGVFVGILWVASRGDLTSIPTFIWFIGTVAVLATATAFQWIDPTFLIIGVITVIAFAVAKARNVFGGSTLFAGESG